MYSNSLKCVIPPIWHTLSPPVRCIRKRLYGSYQRLMPCWIMSGQVRTGIAATSNKTLCCNHKHSTVQLSTCAWKSQLHHDDVSYSHVKASVQTDLMCLCDDIIQLLHTDVHGLHKMCCYYFDGKGKRFRPMIVFLISHAFNLHKHGESNVSVDQRKVALISELIHVGSLIHDDVVDFSTVRRGKQSVNFICGDRNAVMAGNFIVSNSSRLLASIGNHDVTAAISQVIEDIVGGEFMQQDNQGDFSHYLKKTYKKTASLIANCCKAAAHLSSCSDAEVEAAFEYGKNVGVAFQLVDDMLDFVASAEELGKPNAADLKLGLATAPVLFASEKYPQLGNMILRRFKNPGDVEQALSLVANSGAIEETHLLASHYCKEAIRNLDFLAPTSEKDALVHATDLVLHRKK